MVFRYVQGHPTQRNPCLTVPKYSVCNITYFVMRILPARLLTSFSVDRRISYMALDLLARTFGAILRLLRAFSIISRLTPVSFQDLTFEVSSEIVLVATACKKTISTVIHYCQ